MKKRFIASIMIAVTVLMSCAFAFEPAQANAKETIIPETTSAVMAINSEVEEEFTVEFLTEFIDENIDNYTLEELDSKIKELQVAQTEAHELAESARTLGWPEESDPIQMAKAEWANAQLAINAYRTKYNQKYEESEQKVWDQRAVEYPAATEIWLYMKDLGWNDYVCAGIMGNLMAEVGGQTLDIQYWLTGNGYYGMCQWNKAYRSGVWGADLAGQCNFLRDTIEYELDTFGYAYKKGFNYDSFLALSNERDVALAFAKCYERCGSGTYTIRQNNAEKAYDYFVNN